MMTAFALMRSTATRLSAVPPWLELHHARGHQLGRALLANAGIRARQRWTPLCRRRPV